MKGLKDFEWASVTRYISYIDQLLGLDSVSGGDVYSFRVDKSGVEGLEKRKLAVMDKLSRNNEKIGNLVSRTGDSIGEEEKVALRSMYRSNLEAIKVVEQQVIRLKRMTQMIFFANGDSKPDESEVPF